MSRKGTQVTTGKVRMNYVNVEKPRAFRESEEPKYSLTLLIPKSDGKTLMELGEALDEMGHLAIKKWGYVPADLKLPLRDGDAERPDDQAYAGHYFLSASSLYKPLLLDDHKRETLESGALYSGVYGRVVIRFYLYEIDSKKGVGCQLLGVQKLFEGERLGTGITADDFEEDWDL